MAKKKTISAKAVLTTGGFGANMEMVTEYSPCFKRIRYNKPKDSTGDGIQLAKESEALLQ